MARKKIALIGSGSLHASVYNRLCGGVDVGIGSHIGSVLAAQFEVTINHGLSAVAADGTSPLDGTREDDMVDMPLSNQFPRAVVADPDVTKDSGTLADVAQGMFEVITDQGGRAGML